MTLAEQHCDMVPTEPATGGSLLLRGASRFASSCPHSSYKTVCLAPSIITVDRQLRDVPPRAYEVNSIYLIALCTYGCVLFPAEQHIKLDLNRLGYRCLHEPASRRLDGEIYCAVHNVSDRNTLINDQLLQARENAEVLVAHGPGDGLAWIEGPHQIGLRFTSSKVRSPVPPIRRMWAQ